MFVGKITLFDFFYVRVYLVINGMELVTNGIDNISDNYNYVPR